MSGVAGLSDDPVKDRGVTASEIAPLPNSLLPELIQMSFLSTVVHSICFPLVKMCRLLGTLEVRPKHNILFSQREIAKYRQNVWNFEGSKDPKIL